MLGVCQIFWGSIPFNSVLEPHFHGETQITKFTLSGKLLKNMRCTDPQLPLIWIESLDFVQGRRLNSQWSNPTCTMGACAERSSPEWVCIPEITSDSWWFMWNTYYKVMIVNTIQQGCPWSILFLPKCFFPVITVDTYDGCWCPGDLTLSMRGPSYLGSMRSVLWLLMLWLLASAGHQQPWYWLCEIGKSWYFTRKDFNYLCHVSGEDWHKM